MLWKKGNEILQTPSTYSADITDTDNDSYTSAVDGSLIDNPIAVRNVKTFNGLEFKLRRRGRGSNANNIYKSSYINCKSSRC